MNNAPAVTRYTTSLKVLWMNKLLLDFRLPLRSTPLPCLDCSRDLWPGNLRRHKPSIMVLAKLEKRAYRSWKRWLCDLPLDVLNLLIYFSQDSSAGCVTSCVSPTAPRTRWSSSRPLGTRTPAPSQASSELFKDSIKENLSCYCLPSDWHSRQNLPLENIYCLPLLFVWIALLMIERKTSCQKFMFTSDLKISKFLSAVTYFLL